MNKIINLLIAILSFSCCEAQDSADTKTTLITADPSLLKSDIVLFFAYSDSIWGHPFLLHQLQNKLLINSPVCLFQSNANQTPYLIYPGENIDVKAGSDHSLVFSIEGNEQRTNELNFFRLIVKNYGPVYNYFPMQSYQSTVSSLKDLSISEQKINMLKNKRINFLDSFYTKKMISNEFAEIAKTFIESAAFRDSLLLFWSNKSSLAEADLYDKMVSEKLQSFRYITFEPYFIYLVNCTTLASMLTTKYLDKDLHDSIDVEMQFAFAEKNFTGIVKDYILSKAIYSAYEFKIPLSKEITETFYRECKDNGYKKLITEKINEESQVHSLTEDNMLMPAEGGKNKSIQAVINSYQGKIIVLDFWASWCAPCRKEMPFSKQLYKDYLDKNVVCLYISTDENVKDWQHALEEECLDKTKSFLLLSSAHSSFMKSNHIQAIPRYIVLNEKGQIIYKDAPRPSDKGLKELLDKMLMN